MHTKACPSLPPACLSPGVAGKYFSRHQIPSLTIQERAADEELQEAQIQHQT
jgi:hypothetical protein